MTIFLTQMSIYLKGREWFIWKWLVVIVFHILFILLLILYLEKRIQNSLWFLDIAIN
jgi:hypothetical protein